MCDASRSSFAAIAQYAGGLADAAGVSLSSRSEFVMADASLRDGNMSPEQRVMLAVACDLHDLLSKTAQGRQALSDLGFDPVPKDSERE